MNNTPQNPIPNRDQVEGKLKQAQGRVQDAVGDLTNDPEDDLKGKARVVEGKVQEAFGNANNRTWAHRLSTVRVFARWLHSLDGKHEVLPQSLIPSRSRRPHPYIHTEDEVRQIVQAAA